MVINSSQVLISELEFRSHSGDLAPLLYYYKQKPCTLQGRKIDNSLTNICRWCTEMCVFWPKAAALPCFPAEHSANAVIHSPYELLVPLIPLKNCFHTSIAARLILPENFISQSGMLRWPVQLRIHLSNVRKFDRIAFYLRTVFLDKVLSAFRVYQQAGNAFFAIDRSSLFHQKLRIIFLNAPIISNGNVAHTLSLCVRALVAAVSRDLAIKEMQIRSTFIVTRTDAQSAFYAVFAIYHRINKAILILLHRNGAFGTYAGTSTASAAFLFTII